MAKAERIYLRKKVQEYSKNGMSDSDISRCLGVSRKFVKKWKEVPTEELEAEQQGWKKGRKRRYSEKDEEKVVGKRKELEKHFFWIQSHCPELE